LIISLSDGKDNLNTSTYLDSYSAYFTNSLTLEKTVDFDSQSLSSELTNSESYDQVIIGVFAKVKYGTGKITILPTHAEFLSNLSSHNKNFTVISFGNPYLLKEFPGVPSYICAYGDADVSIEASLMTVTGQIKFKGKLPVSINEEYEFGTGIVK